MRKRIVVASASALAAPLVIPSYGVHANTFTRLIPDMYAAVDIVSRGLVGFLPGMRRNTAAERAAVGQPVVWPVTPPLVAVDNVPSMQVPTPADAAIGNNTMTITKSKNVPFGITGEEQRGLNNGVGYNVIQADLIAQALNTLVNEMEADAGAEAYKNASRATGTAGTTPFATSMDETADLRKILDDNGAPLLDRSLVINTSAGANVRKKGSGNDDAGVQGSTLTRRQGQLLDSNGFSIRESSGVANHVKGTGASATTNTAGYAVGATVITLASAGTGTIKQGDVITFAGDTNKYVVVSGDTDVSNGGSITLAKPGLRVAIPAVATNITVGGSYAANVAFSSNALWLATRAPAIPAEGDAAAERMVIVDPRSGIAFEFALYLGYQMVRWQVAAAWGVKAAKEEHIALLLG